MTEIVSFIPRLSSKNKIFYSGTHFYIFFRFLYALYQRFLIAKDLSEQFEVNDKTAGLTSDQREAISTQRFRVFKLAIIFILQNPKET